MPLGANKTVVLESPNGYVPTWSIQNGYNQWFTGFKADKLAKVSGKPYQTTYNSDQPKDKLIRFFVDKSLVPVGESYEFKVRVLMEGEAL